MCWYLKHRFVQTYRSRFIGYTVWDAVRTATCNPWHVEEHPQSAFSIAHHALLWLLHPCCDISPDALPTTLAPGGLLACEALTCDEVKRVLCISSGFHFPSPAGDSLIAFQTAIMSSLLYGFLLKMITISHYFSNKNSTSLPLSKKCTVDFNSTSCLYPACISVFLYIPCFALVNLSNLYLEIFLSTPLYLEDLCICGYN